MRISDWSSDVCSSDLILPSDVMPDRLRWLDWHARQLMLNELLRPASRTFQAAATLAQIEAKGEIDALVAGAEFAEAAAARLFERSEEHTSELQSLMRISYAVFCLKKKKKHKSREKTNDRKECTI